MLFKNQNYPDLLRSGGFGLIQKLLETDGVIGRIVYNQVPPKVEYELSDYGSSLSGILNALCSWGEGHLEKVYEDKFEVLEEGILNDHLK